MEHDVPPWASFFDRDDYREFMRLTRAELERRSPSVRFEPGLAIVLVAGTTAPCGLTNLAQDCKRIAKGGWAERIRFHFATLFEALERQPKTGAAGADFPTVARELKVRLYPVDWLHAAGEEKVVYRRPAHEMVSVLVRDLPTMVISVLREQVAHWGIPEDELFALGVRNVAAAGKLTTRRIEVVPGGVVHRIWDESLFASTHALLLDAYLDGDAANAGALVVVPNRHAVVFHPLRRAALALPVAKAMLGMALQMFEEGPGSLSPHVHWWQDGRLTWLPVHADGPDVRFAPPPSFDAMLAALG